MRSSWVSSRVRRDRVRGAGADARERRAEEACTADGVEHTCLGYGVSVKLKWDALLLEVRHEGGYPSDERPSTGGPGRVGT